MILKRFYRLNVSLICMGLLNLRRLNDNKNTFIKFNYLINAA